jgi:hypothetical protein
MYTPNNLKRWTLPKDYGGKHWPDYYSSGVGQHRDSDALTRSNFICMLKALGGESDTVIVVCENHWAVGWVEWIAIHQDDEKALTIADEIDAALSDYPVLDEEHFSQLEQEEADQVWANCYNEKDRIAYIRKFRGQFDFHDWREVRAVVRGDYFIGYASELIQ